MDVLVNRSIEYLEDGTSHGNINGLFDVISPGQENVTILGSSVADSAGSCKGYNMETLMLVKVVQ